MWEALLWATGHCQLPALPLASQCEVAAADQPRGGSLGHSGNHGRTKPLSWSSRLCQEAMGAQVLWHPGPVSPLGWQLLALYCLPVLCEVPTGWSRTQGSGLRGEGADFGGADGCSGAELCPDSLCRWAQLSQWAGCAPGRQWTGASSETSSWRGLSLSPSPASLALPSWLSSSLQS